MKKTMIILALALVMVAMSVTAAYAYKVDVVVSDPASGVPAVGNGIHGTYATGTSYCKSCHDVHGGTIDHANDAYLFRWATATAGCVACHDGSTGAALTAHTVYATAGAQLSEHFISATTLVIPDSTADATVQATGGDGVAGLGCADCHNAAPHGMGEGTLFVDGALIKSATATTIEGYCGTYCHDKNDMVAPDAATTHPMAAAEAVAYADAPATSCIACHNETLANGFPHESTTGYAFLGADAGTTAEVYLDGVCLNCHSGVGTMF